MTAPPVARPRLGPWLGLAGFYAASFAVLGLYMQFFPVWLKEQRGLDAAQLTVVLSAQTLARTLAGPLWAQCVDRRGHAAAVLRWLAFASVGAFAAFGAAGSLVGLFAVSFAFGCLYPPMHPILDALAMQSAHDQGFAYGRLRMVGSLAYLVVIVAAGCWLEQVASTAVFPLLLGCLALTAVAGLWLPGPPRPAGAAAPQPGAGSLRALLRSPPFLWLLGASALIQGSHAVYYNLSTVHWTDHGIGKDIAGALWAEGIVAEIALLYVARDSVERLRPTTLLQLGAAAAVVRWILLGSTCDLVWLFAGNWLHAASFTCTYLGALRALERRVPREQRATAQGLLGAANSGVGMVVASLLGGAAYARAPAAAFFLMAAFAALGGGLAFHLRRLADRAQPPAASSPSSSTP